MWQKLGEKEYAVIPLGGLTDVEGREDGNGGWKVEGIGGNREGYVAMTERGRTD